MREKLLQLKEQLGKVICGKDSVIELLLVAFASEESVLLQDVPGVGKTTLAKGLAALLQAEFKRVQFTPDLLPSDIIGGAVYNPTDGTMRFRKGPIFGNIVLADEINRASPRTQSALLEAMSEHQVSADGVTYPLPRPFIVLATENPIEFQGTYSLPEAQLDRFAMRLSLGYPEADAELRVLSDRLHGEPMAKLRPVMACEEIQKVQEDVRAVHVDESVLQYILEIIRLTRQDERLSLGVSPRGALHLSRCSQALAYMNGRDYVLPEDVKKLAVSVLAHRIVVESQSAYAGLTGEGVIAECVNKVKIPK